MRHTANAMCITPFAERGDVDYGAFAELIERIARSGLGVFVGGSSPGQGYTLSADESRRLLQTARHAAAGRVRVMASGFEPRTAQMLIDFAEVVRSAGVDGMQVYSLDIGHGGRPSEGEIHNYFTLILSSIDMPAVISTHENMGYLIPHDVLAALVRENANVVGLNINTSNIAYIGGAIDAAASARRDVEVHVGSAEASISALAIGASGFLTAEANLVPEDCAALLTGWDASDIAQVSAAYRRVTALSPILRLGTATRGLKAAMEMLGLPGTSLRPPLLPLTGNERELVARCLTTAGLSPVADHRLSRGSANV